MSHRWRPDLSKLIKPGRPVLLLSKENASVKQEDNSVMDFKKLAAWIGAGLVAATGGAVANAASRADVESRLIVLEVRMDRLTQDTTNIGLDVKKLLNR